MRTGYVCRSSAFMLGLGMKDGVGGADMNLKSLDWSRPRKGWSLLNSLVNGWRTTRPVSMSKRAPWKGHITQLSRMGSALMGDSGMPAKGKRAWEQSPLRA